MCNTDAYEHVIKNEQISTLFFRLDNNLKKKKRKDFYSPASVRRRIKHHVDVHERSAVTGSVLI